MSARKANAELTRALAEIDLIVRMARGLWTVRLPGSISPEQLEALRLIDKHAPLGSSALARFAQVRPASMSRMVGVLEKQGLVRRRPDKVDGRSILISLTVRGRRTLQRANQMLIQRMGLAVEGLAKEEAALLPRLASKLKLLDEGESQPDDSGVAGSKRYMPR